MQGLPHAFRDVIATNGTAIKVSVETEIGGDWYLQYNSAKWELILTPPAEFAAEISIPPDIGWKLFSKGIKPADAEIYVEINGDISLAKRALQMVSVMA
jgi:hypothetical protein